MPETTDPIRLGAHYLTIQSKQIIIAVKALRTIAERKPRRVQTHPPDCKCSIHICRQALLDMTAANPDLNDLGNTPAAQAQQDALAADHDATVCQLCGSPTCNGGCLH